MTRKKPVFRPGWVLHLAPAVLSVVTAFVLGSLPAVTLPGGDFEWSDKVGHFLAFGLVQITHARAAEFIWPEAPDSKRVWGAVVSAMLVGGLLEIWQGFLGYRAAEVLDFAADTAGALGFGWVYFALRRDRV